MKKLGIGLIALSFLFFLPSALLIADTAEGWLFPHEYDEPGSAAWHFIKVDASDERPHFYGSASAVGIMLLITGVFILRQSGRKRNMTRKQLWIVSVMVLGVGLYMMVPVLYGEVSYLPFPDEHERTTLGQKDPAGNWELQKPDDVEFAAVSVIGLAVSLSWYPPFFVVSYWLYRKSKAAL